MKKQSAITLVKNGTVVYPFQESDYEKLRQMNCPIINLTTDYLPLFAAYIRKQGSDVQFIPFDPIEAEMIQTKVMPRWEHSLSATQAAITLTYPKGEDEESVEKLIQAFKRWYRRHYITFDVQIRRTAKKVTVTMKKIYGQPE